MANLSRMSRDAKLLLGASGILATSFVGIQALLKPIYVLRLGYGPSYLGTFTSAGAFTFMVMGLISGNIGKRIGTRLCLILGGAGTTLGMVILPLAEFVPAQTRAILPIVSEIVLATGWSLLNVNLVPALAAVTPRQLRDSAYGLNNALMGVGTLIGNLFGGMLPGFFADRFHQILETPVPYRWALWTASGLAVAGLFPLTLIENEDTRAVTKAQQVGGSFPLRPVVFLAIYVCLRHAGWATGQIFCRPYMDTDLALSTFSIGLITGVGQALAVLASLLMPRLAARYSNGWILVTSPLFLALGLLPVGLSPRWTTAAVAQGFTLTMTAVWLPAFQSFQMKLVDDQWRSLAYGAAALGMGLGFGSVSLLGGRLVEAKGYPTVFLLGALLSLISGAIMWGLIRTRWVEETSNSSE